MINRDGTETLYMAVTADRYEMPFAVFYSLDEAAEWSGMKKNAISSSIWRDRQPGANKFNLRGYKFVKVVIENAWNDRPDEGHTR